MDRNKNRPFGGYHGPGLTRPAPIEDQQLARALGPELTNAFMLAEYGQPIDEKTGDALRAKIFLGEIPDGTPMYNRVLNVLKPNNRYRQIHGDPLAVGGMPLTDANSDALMNVFSQSENPGGSGVQANSALGYNNYDESEDVLRYYLDSAAGTPFEGMNPAGIEMMVDNPALLADFLSKQEGAGPNAAKFLGPRTQAALAMSGMGMLGRSSRGSSPSGLPDLTQSPTSDIDKLLAAQEFMEQFNQPGTQFVDVNAVYQDAFNRASNTNFEGLTDENGNPIGVEGSISLTNDALLAAAPFMSQETQAWLSSTLQYAALQYMEKLATGEISMSYPAYLRSLGIDQMLSGQ